MPGRMPAMGATLVAALLGVSCGSGGGANPTGTPSGGGTSSGPSVRFAGDPTCPVTLPDGTRASPYSPSPPRVNSQPPVGQAVDEMPHLHVAPPATVHYLHDPPTSGCHYSLGFGQAPVAPGAYDQAVPAERWVHNLEHGYVAVLYNCPSGCAADVAAIVAWTKRQKAEPGIGYAKILVMPWPTMQPRFAAVSWDWYDPMQTADTAELQRFYDNHVGQAPEGKGLA